MISLEAKLAKNVELMTESQRSKFAEKSKGMRGSVEPQVLLSEQILQESGRRIARNNGGTRNLTEAESRESAMAECDRILFEGMEKCRSTAKGLSDLVESGGEYVRVSQGGVRRFTTQQGQDYDFARLIGLSESDAEKVAKSGCLRD